ncbi:PQQ-dependent sugar dehydrogenase [Sphingomonas sp. LB-2]|uniref:PQQ-dependent sugar dehydrogenase n=1 Tax=Sphingomonas caeni TaxID=2984949 RepID=UPI00222E93F1|nr:PQQ-dependent sugar dehydrogenase [Sphingomonas caeni]MCW3849026.1 PQQ-dependent sugar dehydrogenase [Sphingomonas caeni]
MRTLSALPLLFLAACSSGGSGGGGGGTPTPTPSSANRAPSFTSPATTSVAENTALAYQAAANDPDGNPLSFTIAGGADAALFTITGAGALSFNTAPSFETPRDSGANNVYNLQLRVSDGSLSATLDLAITVTNSREGIAVRRVGTGFNQPLYVEPIPGSSDVLVAEKPGNIYRLTPSTGAKTLVLTAGNLSTDGERGLLGIAVRPNFATSNQLVAHATAPNGTIELRLYTLTGNVNTGYTNLVTIPHAGANNHNGGWIGFGPDGNLYDAVGDGGGSGDPENDAQDPNSRLGKILRLAPSGNTFVAAPGNPFASGGGDPYVFALGLRNPFRNSFGPDGRLYIGDVGQGAIEEIDVVRPDQPGLNFGWHYLEGTSVFTGTAPPGLTAPVSQYAHGTGATQGNTIIGGYVYRGPVTSLVGSYVFADYVNGHIWTLPANQLVQGSLFPAGSYERRNLDFTPDAGTIDQIVSFGEDSAGNLYIVDITGEIFEVVPG